MNLPYQKVSLKKRKAKEQMKLKLTEAKYLITNCGVPYTQVSKRLKLKVSILRRLN